LHGSSSEFFRPDHRHKQIDEEQQPDDSDNNCFHAVPLQLLAEADIKCADDKKDDDDSNENQIAHKLSRHCAEAPRMPSRRWRIPAANQSRKSTSQCECGETPALIKELAKVVKKSLTSSLPHPITVNPGGAGRNALVNILLGNLVREVSDLLPEEIDLLVYA
jgi:hypothetical protein